MFDLSNYSLPTIFLAGFAAILAAIEFGHWLGARVGDRGDDNVPTLEGAMIGLLALMFGFTFALALTRFDARRTAVLAEANAISTTALRARLLPEPHRKEVLGLLKDYVKIRLDVTQRQLTQAEWAAAIDRSNAIQEKLWQQAMAIAASDTGMVPTGLFILALNETIDDQARRLSAQRSRVPNVVQLTLFGIAVVASGFAGYATGVKVRRSRIPVYVMGLLVCCVLVVILDLDRPGAGFIEASQQPMIDAAASLAAISE
ncbi:hypothetical protein M2281_005146 [Mesorhizobium soli]|uniref:bestrophin-like domain n=1 Tax=Pseudaminobacter soli (ex Li et al. 2025) TaxID=1295366 RepID=UPI0024768648|nr:hypothetical protein [Mesorhizobium soli]MDH6234528.1 hypothetical protein [Mesorhizobium soli]